MEGPPLFPLPAAFLTCHGRQPTKCQVWAGVGDMPGSTPLICFPSPLDWMMLPVAPFRHSNPPITPIGVHCWNCEPWQCRSFSPDRKLT